MQNYITTTINGEKAYRLKHIANMLDLNVETVRRYVRKGYLKTYKFGKQYYVTQSQFDKFVLDNNYEPRIIE